MRVRADAEAVATLSDATAPVVASAPARESIERTQILERVLDVAAGRLVLVHGPAGSGKTTVMRQLYERYGHEAIDCAWHVFDDGDNEMSRLLVGLSRTLQPVLGPPPATGSPSTSLLERVAAHRRPFVLFLDDCELLLNRGVVAYFSRLIEQLPPDARLIVGTRSLPAHGFARLRVHGQLVDIDARDLRFSFAEAEAFLNTRHQLALSHAQIQSLLDVSEHWIGALSLAATALKHRSDVDAFIAELLGSNQALMRYLGEDVFARQPAEFREFLLKTSIVELLTPSLCEALYERPGHAAVQLQRIERANLFLTPVDENRSAYRYHKLFAEFLRQQLREQHPEWEAPAHRAAADWFLQQGRPIPATDHLLKAGEWARALVLVDAQAEGLLSAGRHSLVHRWISSLNAQGLALSMRLRLYHAWAATLTLGPRVGLAMLEVIDADVAEREPFEAQLLAFRALLFGMIDCIDEAHTLALAWLPRVAPEFGFTRGMLAQTLANTSLIRGELLESRQYADEARRVEQAPASPFNFALADAIEGALHLRQGRLLQARLCLNMAAGISGDQPISGSRNVFCGVLLAEVQYEAGDWRSAQRHLELFVPLVQQCGLPDHLIIAHTLLARILGDHGEQERAERLLSQLEALGARLSLPRLTASARLERARALLQRGEIDAAGLQLDQAGDMALWEAVASRTYIANDLLNPNIGRLRWQIFSGRGDPIASLTQQIEQAEKAGLRRRALKLSILLALAQERAGERKLAMRALDGTLGLALSEGFVSSFIEEGEVVHALLDEFLDARQGTSLLSAAAAQALQAQLAERRGRQPAPAAMAAPAAVLTAKEQQVIELLARGHTNNGIADALHVSETTVRTHLRSINVKLGASSRTQALLIARQQGLMV